MSRESVGNSFTRRTLEEITQAITDAGDAEAVRAIVLTGAGSRFFSSGGDVNDYEHYAENLTAFRAYMRTIERTLDAILQAPKPIIARINGIVAGGANAFHLAADLAIAADHASFRQVGTKIGSVAGLGPTQWWPLVVGDKRARELLLTCRPLDAKTALAWGVVNSIHPLDELDAAVSRYAADLSSTFPEALRYTRMSLNAGKETALREVTHAREWLQLHFSSIESREGIDAFLHQRAIDYEEAWRVTAMGRSTTAPYGPPDKSCPNCGAARLPRSHQYCGVCGGALLPPEISEDPVHGG